MIFREFNIRRTLKQEQLWSTGKTLSVKNAVFKNLECKWFFSELDKYNCCSCSYLSKILNNFKEQIRYVEKIVLIKKQCNLNFAIRQYMQILNVGITVSVTLITNALGNMNVVILQIDQNAFG